MRLYIAVFSAIIFLALDAQYALAQGQTQAQAQAQQQRRIEQRCSVRNIDTQDARQVLINDIRQKCQTGDILTIFGITSIPDWSVAAVCDFNRQIYRGRDLVSCVYVGHREERR
jgi:hypothetical protein